MNEEDKRQFTRYSKETLCDVIVDSEIHKGKVVNYSDGVGVLMKNVPELVKGTLADIRILDCEIEFGAEVVWRQEVGYHLKVGFKRLDNLKGNLKHYRLVDILLGLSKSRKTGILEIITGSTVKKIFIENGQKIFAVSTNTNDRLGEHLLTQGKITLEEYTQASYLVEKKGRRLGQVLIDLGYLKPSDLAPSVQHQLEEIIMGLFNIDEGKFEFKEGPLSSDEPIKLNISSANIIYNGIKRINSFPMVDKMCPPLETVFNLSKDPISLFQSLTLDYADKKILANVNGIHTLKNILSLSHNSNFETLKAVIALLTIGLITIKGENEDPKKLPLEVIFGEPVEAKAEERVEEKIQDDVTHVETGTTDMTVEHINIVENKRNIQEVLKDEEPAISEPHETPVEETAEENDAEQAAVDTGVDKSTVEYTNIVENQENLKETSEDEGPSLSEPVETPVEEIAEEIDEEEAAVDTGFNKSTVEYTNIVENQENLKEIPKDEGPSLSELHETPVEEMAEEIDEEEAAVDTGFDKSTVEYTNIVENQEKSKEASIDEEPSLSEPVETPVEEIAEEIDEEEAAVDTGFDKSTVEYTNIVENQENLKETSKDEGPSLSEPVETPVEETAEEIDAEQAAVDTGFDKSTIEYTNIVENQEILKEASKDEEPSLSEPHETPVEEIAEEIDEEEAAVDTGVDKSTVEYTNIVENQENLKETSEDEGPSLSELHETPVEEMAEEIDTEQAAVDTGFNKSTVEYTNIVENQENIQEIPKDEEPSLSEPHETPVEEMVEEEHEETAVVATLPTAEAYEYKSSIESIDKNRVLSSMQGAITDEHNDTPIENVTGEITEDQPVADNVKYTQVTSGTSEPVADIGAATSDERYVQENDVTSDNLAEELLLDDVQPITDNADATENTRSKKKWVISVCIILIITGALVPLVYNNVKTPLSSPAATTVSKNESVTSIPDKGLNKASIKIAQDERAFPSFRDDAINKLLNE